MGLWSPSGSQSVVATSQAAGVGQARAICVEMTVVASRAVKERWHGVLEFCPQHLAHAGLLISSGCHYSCCCYYCYYITTRDSRWYGFNCYHRCPGAGGSELLRSGGLGPHRTVPASWPVGRQHMAAQRRAHRGRPSTPRHRARRQEASSGGAHPSPSLGLPGGERAFEGPTDSGYKKPTLSQAPRVEGLELGHPEGDTRDRTCSRASWAALSYPTACLMAPQGTLTGR